MNKVREILHKMPISSLLFQTEEEIFQLIEGLVPQRYDSDPTQTEYEEGMECAYRIIERRIAKLREE